MIDLFVARIRLIRNNINSLLINSVIDFRIIVVGIFCSLVIGACSTANFRWYSPDDVHESEVISRYEGESVYESKYLLSEDLSVDDPVLFEIGDSVQFHASDLMTRLEDSHLLMRGGILEWDRVADSIEYILMDTLVSLVADTFQLEQDSASWGDYTLVRNALLGKVFLDEVVYGQVVVDSAEVDSFYHARPDIFTYFGQVNIGHIVLSKGGYRGGEDSSQYVAMADDDLDELILTRLRYLKDAITDSSVFEEMANKYSQDRRTGEKGGRLGWIEQYNLHPEIEDVLYDENTPLKEVIGPVESRDGVHLFYMYGRHYKGVPPLNADRYNQAYNYILGPRVGAVYSRLRDSLRVLYPTSFDDSTLSGLLGGIDPSAPVAWSSDIDTVRFEAYERARGMVRSKIPVAQVLSIEQLRTIAQGLVDTRLILKMSEELGLNENADYMAKAKVEAHNFSRAALRRRSRDPNFKPSQSEIEKYFHEHKSEYSSEKPVQIQQIVFTDSLKAEFVRALAESGEDFLDLADIYYPGDTAIRREAANLGYIGPMDFETSIYEVAERGYSGDITPPIKTQYGFHIVKILDVKRGLSLGEKRPEIIIELKRLHDEQVKRSWYLALTIGRNVSVAPVRYRGIVMGPATNRSSIQQVILPAEVR